MKTLSRGLAALVLLIAATSAVHAESLGPDSEFRASLDLRIWIVGLTGDIVSGGSEVDVDADFGDIFDASDSIVAFSGRAEVGVGKWAGFVDGFYADLGFDDRSGSRGLADIDVTLELGVLDFGIMYRVVDEPLFAESLPTAGNTIIDIYAGARAIDIELELDPAMAMSETRSRDWVDPIVGVKIIQPLNDWLHVGFMGDIGGFGVSSDLTWQAAIRLGFDFHITDDLPATFYIGYRAIGWDYTHGSGDDRFEWDITLHGPMLGFVMRF